MGFANRQNGDNNADLTECERGSMQSSWDSAWHREGVRLEVCLILRGSIRAIVERHARDLERSGQAGQGAHFEGARGVRGQQVCRRNGHVLTDSLVVRSLVGSHSPAWLRQTRRGRGHGERQAGEVGRNLVMKGLF